MRWVRVVLQLTYPWERDDELPGLLDAAANSHTLGHEPGGGQLLMDQHTLAMHQVAPKG